MKKKKKNYIGTDYEGRDIYVAETDEINKLRKGTLRFLQILAPFVSSMSPEEWAENCFVSDLSTMGDFNLKDKQLKALSKKLGFAITHDSYIKDIAMTI